jgi:hypothetical protein
MGRSALTAIAHTTALTLGSATNFTKRSFHAITIFIIRIFTPIIIVIIAITKKLPRSCPNQDKRTCLATGRFVNCYRRTRQRIRTRTMTYFHSRSSRKRNHSYSNRNPNRFPKANTGCRLIPTGGGCHTSPIVTHGNGTSTNRGTGYWHPCPLLVIRFQTSGKKVFPRSQNHGPTLLRDAVHVVAASLPHSEFSQVADDHLLQDAA